MKKGIGSAILRFVYFAIMKLRGEDMPGHSNRGKHKTKKPAAVQPERAEAAQPVLEKSAQLDSLKTRRLQARDILLQPMGFFCVFSVLCMLALLLVFYITQGYTIGSYFFADIRDTGMDFFHSIEYVRGRQPYEKFDTLYPPLANLFFYMIYRLIPGSISSRWPDDFEVSVQMRGTDLDLRTYQAPMLLFLVVVIASVLIFSALVEYVLRDYPRFWSKCTAVCMVFSFGMLYAIERGNILFLVVGLTLFFLEFRKSENRVLKELALLALAAAAGLKLYPAFFGVLLLRDKDYKAAARTILYGILSVVLPALCFKEGISGLGQWIGIVLSFGSGSTDPCYGSSVANILHQFARVFTALSGVEVPEAVTGVFPLLGMLTAALLLAGALFMKKEWHSMVAIVLAITAYQAQGQYVFCLYLLPLVYLLRTETKFYRRNVVPYAGVVLLVCNLPTFNNWIGLSQNGRIQLCVLLLLLWCFWQALSDAGDRWRNRQPKEASKRRKCQIYLPIPERLLRGKKQKDDRK